MSSRLFLRVRSERGRARAVLELAVLRTLTPKRQAASQTRIPQRSQCVGTVGERCHGTLSLDRAQLMTIESASEKWGGPPDHMRDRPKRSAGFNTRDPSLAGLLHLSDERNRIMAWVRVDKV